MIIDNNSITNENYKSNNGYDHINDNIDEYEKWCFYKTMIMIVIMVIIMIKIVISIIKHDNDEC